MINEDEAEQDKQEEGEEQASTKDCTDITCQQKRKRGWKVWLPVSALSKAVEVPKKGTRIRTHAKGWTRRGLNPGLTTAQD